uniref:Uncharacterized protein n=1 Tax=Panagrolaimus davidi TaxID=227884 RepID=A0A914PNK1_9BILA
MQFNVSQRLLNPNQSMADVDNNESLQYGEISLEDLLILERMEEEKMEDLQTLENMLLMLKIQASEAGLLALKALEDVDSTEVIAEPRLCRTFSHPEHFSKNYPLLSSKR